MKLSSILIVLICLFIGLGSGFSAGYLIYQPKIANLEIQVANLASQLATLNQTVSSQKDKISTLETARYDLEIDLSHARAATTRYQQQVTVLESEVSSQREQLSSLQSQMLSSQNRLSNILDIKVTQGYQWLYGQQPWQWELPIPLSLYVEYLERPRPKSPSYYVEMAKDPEDDPYIDQLIEQINDAALAGGSTEIEKLNFVISFVQSLPYTVDIETTPFDEYPRYPIETLFDRGGDCEDTSLLVAAILDRMGYDVAILLLRNAFHMAVGIALPDGSGSYYQQNGKRYFYLETTGEGWQIGEFPPDITDSRGQVYPLKS